MGLFLEHPRRFLCATCSPDNRSISALSSLTSTASRNLGLAQRSRQVTVVYPSGPAMDSTRLTLPTRTKNAPVTQIVPSEPLTAPPYLYSLLLAESFIP